MGFININDTYNSCGLICVNQSRKQAFFAFFCIHINAKLIFINQCQILVWLNLLLHPKIKMTSRMIMVYQIVIFLSRLHFAF